MTEPDDVWYTVPLGNDNEIDPILSSELAAMMVEHSRIMTGEITEENPAIRRQLERTIEAEKQGGIPVQ